MKKLKLIIRFGKFTMNPWVAQGIATRVAGYGEAFGLFVQEVLESAREVHFTSNLFKEEEVLAIYKEVGEKIMQRYGGSQPPLALVQSCTELCGTVLKEEVLFPKRVPYSLSWFDDSEARCGCSGWLTLNVVEDDIATYKKDDVLVRGRRITLTSRYRRDGNNLVLVEV